MQLQSICTCMNVILFTSVINHGLPYADFQKLKNVIEYYQQIYRSEFLAKQTLIMESKDKVYSNMSSMVFTTLKFTKLTSNQFLDYFCTEFYNSSSKLVKSKEIISLKPLRKVWLSMHRFSRNQQSLNGTVCIAAEISFIKTGHKCQQNRYDFIYIRK